MTTTAPASENQTFTITEEIAVRASLEQTFASLVAQMGRLNETAGRHSAADDPGAASRRPLVPRPGRRQRPSVGIRAEHQAAGAAGDLGTAVHVDRRHVEPALPADRDAEGTLITFTHTLVGPFPEEHRPRLASGWTALHARVRKAAEAAAKTGGPMTIIDGLLAELEQEARDDAPCARADTAGPPVVEAPSQVDVARPAGAACGNGARERRRACGAGHDSRAAELRSARGGHGRGARAVAHRQRREGETGARRLRRCEDGCDVAAAERRAGHHGDAARRVCSGDHAEPLVSPPRPVARAICGCSISPCRLCTVRPPTRIRSWDSAWQSHQSKRRPANVRLATET